MMKIMQEIMKRKNIWIMLSVVLLVTIAVCSIKNPGQEAARRRRNSIFQDDFSGEGIEVLAAKITQAPGTQTGDAGNTESKYCTGVAKEIFDAANAARTAAGLVPLEWSDDLASAASIRSKEIADTFSHTRPDGSDWSTVSKLVCGENLMRGTNATGQQIVDAWMNSPDHKDNLLYPDFRTMGISTYNESRGMTACQSFGY